MSQLFSIIKEAAKVGATVTFDESDAVGRPMLRVTIRRSGKSLAKLCGPYPETEEWDAEGAVAEFLHEAT